MHSPDSPAPPQESSNEKARETESSESPLETMIGQMVAREEGEDMDTDTLSVLADALQEDGDERGELLALDLALREPDQLEPEQLKVIQSKRKKLYGEIRDEFEKDFPFARILKEREGFFPTEVDIGTGDLEKLVGSRYATSLESIRLNNFRPEDPSCPEHMSILLDALGSLKRVESLNLISNRIGDKGIATLVASENVKGLHHLGLYGNNIGSEGAAALAASENLNELRSLDLSRNWIGSEGVAALAASENLNELIRLRLSQVELGPEGAASLIASENLRGKLRLLDITDNHLPNEVSLSVMDAFEKSGDCKVRWGSGT